MLSFGKFIGIPFRDGGRDFKGADCWGLAMLVFKEFGIDLPDFKISCTCSLIINNEIEEGKTSSNWNRLEKPVSPCIVTFRMSSKWLRIINHIGVCIGGNKAIHTLEKQGASIFRLDHPYLSQRIEGFYEFCGSR